MALDFQQTDTAGVVTGLLCGTGGGSNLGSTGVMAVAGGVAGSSPKVISLASAANNNYRPEFEIVPAADVSWDAGDWTIRINVTTANMNITLASIFVCHLSSIGGVKGTLGSNTAAAVSMGTTGVKEIVLACSGATPAAGDKIGILCMWDNGAMSTQAFQHTPSALISTPFSVAAGPTTIAGSGDSDGLASDYP